MRQLKRFSLPPSEQNRYKKKYTDYHFHHFKMLNASCPVCLCAPSDSSLIPSNLILTNSRPTNENDMDLFFLSLSLFFFFFYN